MKLVLSFELNKHRIENTLLESFTLSAEKIMEEQKDCQGCGQKHNCQTVYQKMGEAKGASVVSEVVKGFLLPLVIFVASLIAFKKISDGMINTKPLQTVACFIAALLVTSVSILIISLINARFGKKK